MIDMNEIIACNINTYLAKLGKKQSDLAVALELPRQTISKMLNGGRMITAPELKKIADFCKTDMNALVIDTNNKLNADTTTAFMGAAVSDEGRKDISFAAKLMDLYVFHSKFQKDDYKDACNKEWKYE